MCDDLRICDKGSAHFFCRTRESTFRPCEGNKQKYHLQSSPKNERSEQKKNWRKEKEIKEEVMKVRMKGWRKNGVRK